MKKPKKDPVREDRIHNEAIADANGPEEQVMAANGGTVVTRESKVDKTSQTPKVPNVCEKFDVPFIQTFDLLKLLKFKL